nr:MAG TPA: hypothetical protein [Caudoviricetes sp.]
MSHRDHLALFLFFLEALKNYQGLDQIFLFLFLILVKI